MGFFDVTTRMYASDGPIAALVGDGALVVGSSCSTKEGKYRVLIQRNAFLDAAVVIHRHPSLITLRSACDDPSSGRRPAQIPQLDTTQASTESHNSIHNQERIKKDRQTADSCNNRSLSICVVNCVWRFVVAVIGGMTLSIDAQPTVDNSSACESSTFDEDAVNIIKQGMNNVGLIREDLEDVKDLLGSTQQQINATCVSKNDWEDLKAACKSNQQQINASCITRADLENLQADRASNQQQLPQTEFSKQALVSSLLSEYRPRIVNFR